MIQINQPSPPAENEINSHHHSQSHTKMKPSNRSLARSKLDNPSVLHNARTTTPPSLSSSSASNHNTSIPNQPSHSTTPPSSSSSSLPFFSPSSLVDIDGTNNRNNNNLLNPNGANDNLSHHQQIQNLEVPIDFTFEDQLLDFALASGSIPASMQLSNSVPISLNSPNTTFLKSPEDMSILDTFDLDFDHIPPTSFPLNDISTDFSIDDHIKYSPSSPSSSASSSPTSNSADLKNDNSLNSHRHNSSLSSSSSSPPSFIKNEPADSEMTSVLSSDFSASNGNPVSSSVTPLTDNGLSINTTTTTTNLTGIGNNTHTSTTNSVISNNNHNNNPLPLPLLSSNAKIKNNFTTSQSTQQQRSKTTGNSDKISVKRESLLSSSSSNSLSSLSNGYNEKSHSESSSTSPASSSVKPQSTPKPQSTTVFNEDINPPSYMPDYNPNDWSDNSNLKYSIQVQDAPAKSRVETQIKIRMDFYPPPPESIVHLPTDTISKPKLQLRDPFTPIPTALSLDTIVVCDTDMNRFVNICRCCVNRERKRAFRKKTRLPIEEAHWSLDKEKRAIVFNCKEIVDFGPLVDIEVDGKTVKAKRLELPIRMACYCRHHHEKVGFR